MYRFDQKSSRVYYKMIDTQKELEQFIEYMMKNFKAPVWQGIYLSFKEAPIIFSAN